MQQQDQQRRKHLTNLASEQLDLLMWVHVPG